MPNQEGALSLYAPTEEDIPEAPTSDQLDVNSLGTELLVRQV